MDVGARVTKELVGTTDAEKVFTPRWMVIHNYLIYFLVALGLIALPLNCMLSVSGNCSYDLSNYRNYALPDRMCRLTNDGVLFESRHFSRKFRDYINRTYGILDHQESQQHGRFQFVPLQKQNLAVLKGIFENTFENKQQNSGGCYVKPNPRYFPFHLYWSCVGRLGPLVLYFPHLIIGLALVFVLLERLLTRYLWTGRRMEKLYSLLVKQCLEQGDIGVIDTKENRRRCQEILWDFRGSSFYCRAYVTQTALKLVVGTGVLSWSLSHCNQLRSSFETEIQSCPVSDYFVTCAIPANGMNVIVFDLCNVTLVLIVLTAAFSLMWHVRFYSDVVEGSKGTWVDKLLRPVLGRFLHPPIVRLVSSYVRHRQTGSDTGGAGIAVVRGSPDLQMLLSLLVEKEGVWAGLLVLAAMDPHFTGEFRVEDAMVTSVLQPAAADTAASSSKRRDVALEWNEPRAVGFLGRNVPREHLMYCLEIDPPLDEDDQQTTMREVSVMAPVECSDDGACRFDKFSTSLSIGLDGGGGCDTWDKESASVCVANDESRKSSAESTQNLVPVSPVTATEPQEKGATTTTTKKDEDDVVSTLKRKMASVRIRKTSDQTVRKFRSVFSGLRSNNGYTIQISFMVSGRKLSTQTYVILSQHMTTNKSPSMPSTTPVVRHQSSTLQKQTLLQTTNYNGTSVSNLQDLVDLLITPESAKSSTSVISFKATWCSLCQKTEQDLKAAARDLLDGGVTLAVVDIDDCDDDLTSIFGVDAVPALVMVHPAEDGSPQHQQQQMPFKVIDSFIGKNCVEDLKSALKNYPRDE